MKKKYNFLEIDALIGQFFNYESVIRGDDKQPFVVRYRGTLKNKEISPGFDQLLKSLEPLGLLASIGKFENYLELIIFPKISIKPAKSAALNLIMFLLTVLSVMFTGGLYSYQGILPTDSMLMIWTLIKSGWPFAVSMLAILSAHEFGHYFAGKSHGVDVTLPFFIPFPFSSFGTMGAFINMRSLPRNRRDLFDIAISGPLSGIVVSIAILLFGLNLSEISTIPLSTEAINGMQMEGNSILYLFLKYLTFGKLLPQPVGVNGLPLVIHWLRYFFTGLPFPWGAEDVMLHPVAWAGWAGLFVTSINLLPVGQLDGGHIFQTVFGKKVAQFSLPYIVGILITLGFFWNGWWMWAGILFFLGRRFAEPLDRVTQLDNKRKWLGYLAILLFLATFIPVPLTFVGW